MDDDDECKAIHVNCELNCDYIHTHVHVCVMDIVQARIGNW